MGPPKNQGGCGSCWSFSTTGAIEALYWKKHGQVADFAEQVMVDCAGSYGENGCHGGLITTAFEYLQDNGTQTEASYPYVGREAPCHRNASQAVKVNEGYFNVPRGYNTELKKAIG